MNISKKCFPSPLCMLCRRRFYRKEHPNNSDEVYGAFINLADINLDEGSSDVRDVPEDLLMVLNYADSFDVHWIMFDCDADEIGELPTYRESWDKLFM